MLIPFDLLSQDALENLITEFILREGTDYGAITKTFAEKQAEIMTQLKQGRLVLCFDPESESCNILTKEEAKI